MPTLNARNIPRIGGRGARDQSGARAQHTVPAASVAARMEPREPEVERLEPDAAAPALELRSGVLHPRRPPAASWRRASASMARARSASGPLGTRAKKAPRASWAAA